MSSAIVHVTVTKVVHEDFLTTFYELFGNEIDVNLFKPQECVAALNLTESYFGIQQAIDIDNLF